MVVVGQYTRKRGSQCPAWGKKCYRCHRENHFSRVCRASRETHVVQNVSQNVPSVPHVLYDEYNMGTYHTSVNHGSRVKPFMCAVTLNGVPVMMEIDTGATKSIISSRQFEQIRQGSQQLQLITENLPTLRTYSGHMTQPAGGVTVGVRHQEQSYTLPSLVVTGNGPNLLGRDWLEHMKLDWSAVHRVDEVDYAVMFPELFKDGLGN